MNVRFAEAVDAVLAHRRDRGMLIALERAGREAGYDELREELGGPLTQGFQRGLDRLIGRALVKRRLTGVEGAYRARFSLTERGSVLARALDVLGDEGRLADDLSEATREAFEGSFHGRAPVPVSTRKKAELVIEGPDAWTGDGRDRGPPLGRGVPTEQDEPFTPRTLREAVSARIEGADPDEPVRVLDADDTASSTDARRFFVVPTESEPFGAISARSAEGEPEAGSRPGEDPEKVLFMEHLFTHWIGPGVYRFSDEIGDDEGLVELALQADHVHFWDAFGPLSDAVVEWALL